MTTPPETGAGGADPQEQEQVRPAPLWDFLLYFLRLGTFGFGGPIALAGYMQRDLVERRRWLSKRD
jgi:chromate transporter